MYKKAIDLLPFYDINDIANIVSSNENEYNEVYMFLVSFCNEN